MKTSEKLKSIILPIVFVVGLIASIILFFFGPETKSGITYSYKSFNTAFVYGIGSRPDATFTINLHNTLDDDKDDVTITVTLNLEHGQKLVREFLIDELDEGVSQHVFNFDNSFYRSDVPVSVHLITYTLEDSAPVEIQKYNIITEGKSVYVIAGCACLLGLIICISMIISDIRMQRYNQKQLAKAIDNAPNTVPAEVVENLQKEIEIQNLKHEINNLKNEYIYCPYCKAKALSTDATCPRCGAPLK